MNSDVRIYSVPTVDHESFDCWLAYSETSDFPLLGRSKNSETPNQIAEAACSYRVADLEKNRFPTVRLAMMRDGRWIAGASCAISPGRFARIRCRNETDVEVGARLLEAIRKESLDSSANFLAIYLEADDKDLSGVHQLDRDWIKRAGFLNLGKMYLMEFSVAQAQNFHFETMSEALSLRLEKMKMEVTQENVDLVNATYQDSLDCADIADLRSTEDTLQSYLSIHKSGQNSWFRVVLSQRIAPVACLFLSEASAKVVEISYLGVIPDFRGKGVGRFCLRNSVKYARSVGANKVKLAVHEKNHPAIQLYRKFGFIEVAAREVWYWSDRLLKR